MNKELFAAVGRNDYIVSILGNMLEVENALVLLAFMHFFLTVHKLSPMWKVVRSHF